MYQKQNNLDEMILNQGYLSDRTKSPRRINPIINHPVYQNNYQLYPNKLNSARDMSPNKLNVKSKPLLGNMNRIPLSINNNQTAHIPLKQTTNKFGNGYYDKNHNGLQHNGLQQQQIHQKTTNFNNIKSPRSNQVTPHNYNNYSSNMNTNPNQKQQKSTNLSTTKACLNHPSKASQFSVCFQSQILYYCQTCAAKLAAQRFTVTPLQKQNQEIQYKSRTIPNLPQYSNNPVYLTIISFLKQTKTIEEYHFENHKALKGIQQHYDNQIEMVDKYYQQLGQIVEQMRRDHLIDLEQEKQKNTQNALIYLSQIQDNLQTIDSIVNDLQEHFQTVVNGITGDDLKYFNQVIDKNRNTIRFFVNQIQPQNDMLKQITNYDQKKLAHMINNFQKLIVDLWSNNQTQQKKSQNVYPSQSNLPKQPNHNQKHLYQNISHQSSEMSFEQIAQQNQNQRQLVRDFQGKGACRKIFDDDQEEMEVNQQVSPKFKLI